MDTKIFTRNEVEKLRKKYPAGTRIRMTDVMEDSQPVKKGELGTVTNVDDVGTIHMRWDSGKGLGIIEGLDHFEIVQEETEEESDTVKKLKLLKKELLNLQKDVVAEVKSELNEVEDLDSVKRINESPSMFTVPFSEIMKSPDFILSPTYYDLPGQAAAIMEKITQLEDKYGAEAYSKIGQFIETLCDKGFVETSKDGKIRLHEKVKETLGDIKKKYFSVN